MRRINAQRSRDGETVKEVPRSVKAMCQSPKLLHPFPHYTFNALVAFEDSPLLSSRHGVTAGGTGESISSLDDFCRSLHSGLLVVGQ